MLKTGMRLPIVMIALTFVGCPGTCAPPPAPDPDTDRDGLSDRDDRCPCFPGLPVNQGCPDMDGDGLSDPDDRCPYRPGPATNQGCPDTYRYGQFDGDGLLYGHDRCSWCIPGPAMNQGIPDRDGDGLSDRHDRCPCMPGPTMNQGCPDTDGDGQFDDIDECRTVPGVPEYHGCPAPISDSDGDNIPDNEDKCPTVKGVREAQGCLPVEYDQFRAHIEDINFDTNKATLKPKSFAILDGAVKLLQQYPTVTLDIRGHTDTRKTGAVAIPLSRARAVAVRDYLLAKGIDRTRLCVRGVGSAEPVASDDTPVGRAKNNRVEFFLRTGRAECPPERCQRDKDCGPGLGCVNATCLALAKYPSLTVGRPDSAPHSQVRSAKPGETLNVRVRLATEDRTPEVIVQGPDYRQTEGHELPLPLPPPTPIKLPGKAKPKRGWELTITLSAPGAEFHSPALVERVFLPRYGDSDEAPFSIRIPESTSAASLELLAAFYHKGQFLGQAMKTVSIGADPKAPSPPPGEEDAVEVDRSDLSEVPADLTIRYETVMHRSCAGNVSAPCVEVWIVSASQNEPVAFTLEPDLRPWLSQQLALLSGLGRTAVGVGQSLTAKRETVRGVGIGIWDKLPQEVQEALKRLRPGKAVQIITNDPGFPWELARIPDLDDDGLAFLGLRFKIARLHVDPARKTGKRVKALAVEKILAVAPDYRDSRYQPLPAQEKELAAVSKVSPITRASDSLEGCVDALTSSPVKGIVHFAGHGAVEGEGIGAHYSLVLRNNQVLGLEAWKGIAPRLARNGAFVFINACQLGAGDYVAGTVEGWGPAVLERGASGYLGGLWNLGDESAADFARRFYEAIAKGRTAAEAVRVARRGFLDRGDPTYLAYVLYADHALRVELADAHAGGAQGAADK